MAYSSEDMYLESSWEERTECNFYEDAPDWFWGPDASADEDEDEDEDEEEFAEDEISNEEKYACDLYNEQYSYPYCD